MSEGLDALRAQARACRTAAAAAPTPLMQADLFARAVAIEHEILREEKRLAPGPPRCG
ncbi:MAG: hypothetical protein AB7E79_16475 [Rhodospirillaceae bacterium]